MNPSRLWLAFRMCRTVVFAISVVLSMILTVIFAVFLVREWRFYNDPQRVVIIVALAINGVSTIILYLMIIVRFRLWLDGARVAFLVVFQGGATVTFAIFRSSLPCNSLGSGTCTRISSVAIIGGWTLAGLLIIYAFCLAIMSYVPRPPAPRNPEDSLNEKRDSAHRPLLMKSSSMSSHNTSNSEKSVSGESRSIRSGSGSIYSQTSWQGPQSHRGTHLPLRSASIASTSTSETVRYGVYRPGTPRSIPSPAPSSITSPVYSDRPAYYYEAGHNRFATYPSNFYSAPPSPPSHSAPHLPNPFLESVSRGSTPSSIASLRSDSFLYNPHIRRMGNFTANSIPPALMAGIYFQAMPPSYRDLQRNGLLARNFNEVPTSASPSPELALSRLNRSITPPALHPAVQARIARDSVRSPDTLTVASHNASIRSSASRRTSLLSVPRSPSPHNFPTQTGLPSSPSALILPTHPRLRPVDLRNTQRVHEVRRFEPSQEALKAQINRRPSAESTVGTPSSQSRSGSPEWVGQKVARPMEFKQMKRIRIAP